MDGKWHYFSNLNPIALGLIILSLIITLVACDIDFFNTRIDSWDPYDEDCNLKEDYQSGGWKKYSDIDLAVPSESRSVEAQKYFESANEIASISAQIYSLERDMAIEEVAKNSLIEYKNALVAGHKKNLVKVFMRMTLLTTDTIVMNSVEHREYVDILTGTATAGVKIAGEALKEITSYIPSTSSIAHDTTRIEGKINELSRAGWQETIASMGDPASIAVEMAKKASRIVMEVPEAGLTDPELAILRKEHLEYKKIDNLIQQADKRNFEKMWKVRELKQKVVYLQTDLLDFEDKEKSRVDDLMIKECERIKDK